MNSDVHQYTDALLEAGKIYFIVMYEDAEFTIPTIQTLRYTSPYEMPGKGLVALFDDLSATDGPKFYVKDEDVAHMVLDGGRLISTLERCFSRKRG